MIAFVSAANNIVPSSGDTNGVLDVFVYNRSTTTTTRISVKSNGDQATGGDSYNPRIAARGEYVVFTSEATNLDSYTTAATPAVFVHKLSTGETTRVSFNSAGSVADGGCEWAAISDDGRFVAFDSVAENLIDNDVNDASDIFIRDRGRMLLGDLNGDHVVDVADLLLLVYNWDQSCSAADLDGDDVVDAADLVILEDNWTE